MLFTFPSRSWFTIGLIRAFSLAGWSRLIHAEFLVLRVTQDTAMSRHASCKGLSPAVAGLSSPFHSRSKYNVAVLQPRRRVATPSVWALPRSLATTRGIIHLFSLPTGTKMFQFPALASTTRVDDRPSDGRVVPFGNLRINGHLHLPGAFRSLSRPS